VAEEKRGNLHALNREVGWTLLSAN
jgi:hypothetical protein